MIGFPLFALVGSGLTAASWGFARLLIRDRTIPEVACFATNMLWVLCMYGIWNRTVMMRCGQCHTAFQVATVARLLLIEALAPFGVTMFIVIISRLADENNERTERKRERTSG